MNNNIRIYSIDLTLTDDCNFACSYCFERGHFNTHKFTDVDLFIKQFNNILNDEYLSKQYELFNIGFWGGEPTLNMDVINELVNYYDDNNRVKFFIYSNGSNTDKVFDLLDRRKYWFIKEHPKICIQTSYDGMPIHDINRKTRNGSLTSSIVRNTIEILSDNKIPNVIKATVTPSTAKYLYDAYKDFNDICTRYSSIGHSYFPTMDYYNLDSYSVDEYKVIYKEFEESLIKIARDEIKYFRKYDKFSFSWFTFNKALCSAGRDMICIDYDGEVYKCHGSMYTENNKRAHVITNLNSDSFVDNIKQSHMFHSKCFSNMPLECKNCEVSYCLKCNSSKYENSKKDKYSDRWTDHNNQPKLCKFFKINDKISTAIKHII